MKKIILMMIGLVMSISVEAQYRGIGRIAAQARVNAYTSNIRRILSTPNYDPNYDVDSDNCSFTKHFIIFGFGIGGGSMNASGNASFGTFDLDLIAMNVLLSIKLAGTKDTSHDDVVSLADGGNSMQIGVLIPIYTFNKEECSLREAAKGKIFIAPLIGFIDADDTTFDGNYMHKHTQYHHCQWWVSDNDVEDYKCTEYGGAIMVKYDCAYLLGKFTNKSVGVSIGLCF